MKMFKTWGNDRCQAINVFSYLSISSAVYCLLLILLMRYTENDMKFFRQTNRRVLLVLSLVFSLALLCVQGVGLHVHNLDHDHGDHHGHAHAIDDTGEHAHLSKAHFAQDTSHSDHHDGAVSEVDISPDGLLKNSSNNIFAIALIAFFFIFAMFVSSRQWVHRGRESKLVLYRRYVLSPPLRAPPQH